MTPEFLTLERPKGPVLAYQRHEPRLAPRATVLLIHGYAEHQGRYGHVVERWNRSGLSVVTWDLRGHGHSQGSRGHIGHFEEYVEDAHDLLAHVESSGLGSGTRPIIIFGHSLGGLIAAHVVLAKRWRYAGLGLSSPFFGLELRVPGFKRALGQLMSRLWPTFSEPARIRDERLTHCPEQIALRKQDPLVLRHVTARWFTETARAQRELSARASELALPIFCLASGADVLASVESTRQLLARTSGPVVCQVLPELFHEILNERDSEPRIDAYAQAFLSWL